MKETSNQVLQMTPLSKELLDYIYRRIQECIYKIETAERNYWHYWGLLDAAVNIYENETKQELPDELESRIVALRPRTRGWRGKRKGAKYEATP
ncbi:hypothetical protein ES706_05243 [subsurface metagenome]